MRIRRKAAEVLCGAAMRLAAADWRRNSRTEYGAETVGMIAQARGRLSTPSDPIGCDETDDGKEGL
jgi:hypothetical protein